MGALLGALDRRLNRPEDGDTRRRIQGIFSLAVLLTATVGAAWTLEWLVSFVSFGVLIPVLAASSLLAQRSLHDHVRDVALGLRQGRLEAGRAAVSRIVGRNPAHLDESGVVRAALESLAENFSDGIVAPALWMVIAGLPGGAFYKATNTADSMIGHRTSRHAAFGWAAARLDDVINLPASRLSALFIVVAAPVVGASPRAAWTSVWRDARRHRSPNAGWPEAALAGALGIQIAGPRVYGETYVEAAFMGDGRRELVVGDIDRALRLYRAACAAQWLALLAAVLIWRG
jgi:adenosylcobinamide-phosphate synthase